MTGTPANRPRLSRAQRHGPLRLQPSAAALHRDLLAAVTVLVAGGHPPPCSDDPAGWTGDTAAVRADVARACGPCPIRELCGAYAESAGETHHVWAGTDRTVLTWGNRPANQPRKESPR